MVALTTIFLVLIYEDLVGCALSNLEYYFDNRLLLVMQQWHVDWNVLDAS